MLATCQDIDSPLADEEAFQKGLHLCASKMHNFPVVHPDHGRPAAAGAQISKTDLATEMVHTPHWGPQHHKHYVSVWEPFDIKFG